MGDPTLPERWLPVAGYEGIYEGMYEVSDLGQVRSVNRRVRHYGGGLACLRGRILKPTPGRDRRLTVKLSVDGITKTRLIHHLVLKAFRGPRPLGLQGCHNNGNPVDNRLANLRWDTAVENMQDALRHGTNARRNRVRCPLRHDLAAPNLVAHRLLNDHRVCLACARGRANVHYERSQGRTIDFVTAATRHYRQIMGLAA